MLSQSARSLRYHVFLKVIAFLAIIGGLVNGLDQIVVLVLGHDTPANGSILGYFVVDLENLLCTLGALLLVGRWPPSRFLGRSGPMSRKIALVGAGWVAGVLIMIAETCILLAGHQYRITGRNPHFSLLASLVYYGIVALWEELAYRGYVRQTLERGFTPFVAAIVSSALFGLAHILFRLPDYPPMMLFGWFVSTLSFGMLLCIACQVTGSLWLAIGLHWGTDVALAFFFPGHFSGVGTYFQSVGRYAHSGISEFGIICVETVLFALAAVVLSWIVSKKAGGFASRNGTMKRQARRTKW